MVNKGIGQRDELIGQREEVGQGGGAMVNSHWPTGRLPKGGVAST